MFNLLRKAKPEPEDVATFIRGHTPRINGSLCVFGDWFGRPMDNCHRLLYCEAKEGYVRLSFDEGETLEVWNPAEVRMEGESFIIQRASRVRWEWFYSGRPKLPENRFFIEHVASGDRIEASSDAHWAAYSFQPSTGKPAISIT